MRHFVRSPHPHPILILRSWLFFAVEAKSLNHSIISKIRAAARVRKLWTCQRSEELLEKTFFSSKLSDSRVKHSGKEENITIVRFKFNDDWMGWREKEKESPQRSSSLGDVWSSNSHHRTLFPRASSRVLKSWKNLSEIFSYLSQNVYVFGYCCLIRLLEVWRATRESPRVTLSIDPSTFTEVACLLACKKDEIRRNYSWRWGGGECDLNWKWREFSRLTFLEHRIAWKIKFSCSSKTPRGWESARTNDGDRKNWAILCASPSRCAAWPFQFG